ncbi:MAG: SDR family oxidoreductase [Candidatus Lokiarchaeota archaeon]|nr:SDR family oxidoreductase [Candidatus Lokiarchaeota archaeon]
MLKNKVAIITGGAQGIGHAIVMKFAEAGANIAIIDIKDSSKTVEEAKKFGVEVVSFIADVSDEDTMKDTFNKIVEKWDKIDILVNNAGIYPLEHFTEIPISLVKKTFDTNLIGTYICSQIAANIFISKSIEGIILNMASAAGFTPDKYHLHYSASKAAVISLTKGMAMELINDNIRVNAIAPGAISTEGAKNPGLFEKSGKFPEKFMQEQMRKFSPLNDAGMGDPIDVANMALYLVSENANYMTGTVVTVDGGRLLL